MRSATRWWRPCRRTAPPCRKITIVPRTSGALGFTMQVEDGDHTLMTKEEILNKIATLTGGRAAEELIFHSITTGASNDIEQATKLARALVTRYGMTEDFDMVALETVNNAYLGGDASLACSEQTAAQVDAKVVEIVQAEHKKAYKLLADNKRKLDEIAQYLYEKETISGESLCAFERTAAVTGGAFGRFHKSGAINLCGCCWFAP